MLTIDGFLLAIVVSLRISEANTCSLDTGGMEIKYVVKRTNLRVTEVHPILYFQNLEPQLGNWVFGFVQRSC